MENSHIVSRHDTSMRRIQSGILDMGDLVISQLEQATHALSNFDEDAVTHLIATDRTINGMHKDTYARAERLIALRQPMALDLRQALSPINIASNLERIGDHAKSTAKRARLLAALSPDPALLGDVEKMSGLVQIMLSGVLSAYDDSDTKLAAEIRDRDREVDQINKDVFTAAVSAIENAPDQAAAYIHIIVLARGFERVGDHVVNIARYVHQIVTGEDLKAAD
ncbi:phosphate transport system regulatory protein PhoU [Parasedimentitalea marina]|uniref:Phosphate-specific transport system accessory protein PhoU n=1 Tax=Parasedimentitalea marina TaxID=2483033 RepID=A0A3T0MZE7_9RHOB|nr:phosphate signaling complex protein PhoU [Parasedimentitalea marina]AZV77146.1 phosphate transport system regulatory protein PhoU [Parasedimentitalea marina]